MFGWGKSRVRTFGEETGALISRQIDEYCSRVLPHAAAPLLSVFSSKVSEIVGEPDDPETEIAKCALLLDLSPKLDNVLEPLEFVLRAHVQKTFGDMIGDLDDAVGSLIREKVELQKMRIYDAATYIVGLSPEWREEIVGRLMR